jgi:hypothetical protein
VVRVDFTDDVACKRIRDWIAEPTEEGFGADVDFVEDRALTGLDEATIAAGYSPSYPHEYRHPVLLVVDSVAVSTPDRPVLVINLNARVDARPFRALPAAGAVDPERPVAREHGLHRVRDFSGRGWCLPRSLTQALGLTQDQEDSMPQGRRGGDR